MNAQEMKERYHELYEYMAMSKEPKNMKLFGHVMTEMMDWLIANKSEAAEEWIGKLESVKWKNYLTPKEAEAIVGNMVPPAPWSREQWKTAMEKNGFELEYKPCYNSCALWATMNAVMSDSSENISKYIEPDKQFEFVYRLALDKLNDKDGKMDIRHLYGL